MVGKKRRAKAAQEPTAPGRAAPGRAAGRQIAPREVARQFERRRRAVGAILLAALLTNAIGLLSITKLAGLGIPPTVLAAGFFGLLLIGVAAASLIYRCPVCHGFLGGSGESRGFLNSVRCPHCGTELH